MTAMSAPGRTEGAVTAAPSIRGLGHPTRKTQDPNILSLARRVSQPEGTVMSSPRWNAPPHHEALPPFTDDEIAVYEAIDGLWQHAIRQGRDWVTRDELNDACPQFTANTVGHHIVWLHLQHLIVWQLKADLNASHIAPSELPPPWRRGGN